LPGAWSRADTAITFSATAGSVACTRGQPLAGALADYLLPGAVEMPAINISHLHTPTPHTGYGMKGMGEGGAVASPAAIANPVRRAFGDWRRSQRNPDETILLYFRPSSGSTEIGLPLLNLTLVAVTRPQAHFRGPAHLSADGQLLTTCH
jgi:hypothetical protein